MSKKETQMSMQTSTRTTLDDADTVHTLEVSTARQVAQAESPQSVSGPEGLSGKRVLLTIHATSDSDGKQPVFMSLNGYAYQIHRGVPVSVPVELVELLRNAIHTSYTPTKAGVEESSAPRYTFTVESVQVADVPSGVAGPRTNRKT